MDENNKDQKLENGAEEFSLELDHFEQEKQEEKLWQARTGLNLDTLCGAIETVVFMNERPISLLKIKELIDPDMPLKVLHESLARLQKEYEQGHHGIRLIEVAEGYQFRTKATYSKYVQDLYKVNALLLGPTALEVLAIIAYKQPASKTDIDKIRGVDSSHIVRALMDKRLVKIIGRSEDVGRPTLYGTTTEFLEVFNLPNISSLPPEYELESMASVQLSSISDIKNLVKEGDKEKFKFDEWEELEKLSESIKIISCETEFTKSLEGEDKKRSSGESEKESPRRSAFDLLEEYLLKKQITDQNTLAKDSNPFVVSDELKIVSDFSAGPFNPPRLTDDENFEMIDLNTGLPLVPVEVEKPLESLNDFFNEGDIESQKEALSKALDEMLDKGLDASFENWERQDDLSLDEMLNNKEEKISAPIEEMIQKGEDLGINISFLRESFVPHSDDPPEEDN